MIRPHGVRIGVIESNHTGRWLWPWVLLLLSLPRVLRYIVIPFHYGARIGFTTICRTHVVWPKRLSWSARVRKVKSGQEGWEASGAGSSAWVLPVYARYGSCKRGCRISAVRWLFFTERWLDTRYRTGCFGAGSTDRIRHPGVCRQFSASHKAR
jgi:hypothetical protein